MSRLIDVGWPPTPPDTPERSGYCYTALFNDEQAAKDALGRYPTFEQVASYRAIADDDEFGDWNYNVDGEQQTLSPSLLVTGVDLVPAANCKNNGVYHARPGGGNVVSVFASRPRSTILGVLISDLVDRGKEITGEAEQFAMGLLQRTNALNSDAAMNYAQMGDYMEEVADRGGFSEIARSTFSTIAKHMVSRWASEREAVAAAKLAASLIYNKEDEPWSPQLFNEAMEDDSTEEQKQSTLLSMAGMVFKHSISKRLEERERRQAFASWKADTLAPAKAFCRAVGVDDVVVDRVLDSAVANSVPMASWVLATLRAAAIPATKVVATVASGGFVSVSLFAAAGIALDWYYESKDSKTLGAPRVSINEGSCRLNHVHRAQQLFAVAGVVSDDVYDATVHTQVMRMDPFFFSVSQDFGRLKDDTAAQRMLTNTLIPPLLQTITTTNKSIIQIPATVSIESTQHIQKAMPDFYVKVVNRSHSHPELWAVRRGFELMTARKLVSSEGCRNVVMVGGNVRQCSKIPGVVANFGPEMSGRDNARHELKGTAAQRNFFNRVNLPRKFEEIDATFADSTGVCFYSTQDISKEDYLRAAIRGGIRKHYVAVNIPVVMMDERITEWDDTILNCRYVRRGNVISMSPLLMPVAGYDNSYEATMSWVKPHRSFLGYDVTVSTLCQVGSSYLLEIDIGVGPQESHDTIWKMPDAGHYVLHDLTCDDGTMRYYTVPAQKFDLVVKFVTQLNGAKNLMEATAGRMLGLEAQIKIGGNVLERAWVMNHREFTSTMVHAIVCSGVDKSDAAQGLELLRRHFGGRNDISFFGRVFRGYEKFFGLEKDNRLMPIRKRGATDYDPVKHWVSRQSSGEGWAKSFVLTADDDGAPTKATKPDSGIVDEGYVSAGDLNEADAESEMEWETSEPNMITRMTQWVRPIANVRGSSDDKWGGFGTGSNLQQLVLTIDEVNDMQTSSFFDPNAAPDYGGGGVTKAGISFSNRFASQEDLLKALNDKEEIVSPDNGIVSVISTAYFTAEEITHTAGPLIQFMGIEFLDDTPIGRLQKSFYEDVVMGSGLKVPFLLLDGIAGSAKSSSVRDFIRSHKLSAAVVVPSRKLKSSWRKERVGPVVTRHGLKRATLSGRNLLVIDEVYAYTRSELFAYLSKAASMGCKVVLLGDRKQQYEDGGELSFNDITFYGVPTLRLCVSNTMPVDALKICRWSSGGDPFSEMFQTRSKVVHSIVVAQKEDPEINQILLDAVHSKNCLVFKDRAGPELQYDTITDEELGFPPGKEEEWLSVSRVQGERTPHSLMLCAKYGRSENFFAEQPGLFYVATSRHSETMMCVMDQPDVSLFEGLRFEVLATVKGRLAALQARERFDAPCLVLRTFPEKTSNILDVLKQRGAQPQFLKFQGVGPVKEDWRPWRKFCDFGAGSAGKVFEATTARLVGAEVPYINTDAVKQPTYKAAQGLWSITRPFPVDVPVLQSKFAGLDRLAVVQSSKDEVLDQKNVIERAARPRAINEDKFRVRFEAEKLYVSFKQAFMSAEDDTLSAPFSNFPSAQEWADSRSSGFEGKLQSEALFGQNAFSVKSQGFLKTQVKVKLKRSFAMEENYGQTVLASPADFNAIFGPWSKMFLRNLRLCVRPGVLLDTGYSDQELARQLRNLGMSSAFQNENFQADVKQQDTSHTPVTLAVFGRLLSDMGVPDELVDIYVAHSANFPYQSMKPKLYKGEAKYNLGSGDPFTLIRNIIQVLTVMVERYGEQMNDANLIVKGDDFICDKILDQIPVQVQEIRDTQLTIDINRPPYHAGRFILHDDIVPDPVRMVAKILAKETSDPARLNELALSFYDRYVPITDLSYQSLRVFVTEAYADFDPEFPLAALDLYHALRDRSLFFELVGQGNMLQEDKLVVLNSADDCARWASSWFISDGAVLKGVKDEPKEVVESVLLKNSVPVYSVSGKPNDFLKRGVWLTEDHAWAVVGLTEYKEKKKKRDIVENFQQ